MIRGRIAVNVFEDDTETDLNIVPDCPPIDDPFNLDPIFPRLPNGAFVPLSAAPLLEPVVNQSQIERHGGSPTVSVQPNLGHGINLGAPIRHLNAIPAEMLPTGWGSY